MKIKTLLVLCFLVVMVLSCNNVVEDVTAPIQNGDSFTVPAEELLSFVRTLPAGNYSIKITGRLYDIHQGDSSYLINSVPEGVYLNFDLTEVKGGSYNGEYVWDSAFQDCTFLTGVSLPLNGYYFNKDDFMNDTNAVSLNNTYWDGIQREYATRSVTYIENNDFSYAFYGCTNLRSVTIPEGFTKIYESMFTNCTSLTEITIPDSVTSIESNAFKYCTSLTNITIPDGVTNDLYQTFFGCTSLTSITIPDSVTSISPKAFAWCRNLTNININESHPTLYASEGMLFNKDKTNLISYPSASGDIRLPDNILKVGSVAFLGCDNLTSVFIPESVLEIATDAFNCCKNLKSITVSTGSSLTINFFSYIIYDDYYETNINELKIYASSDGVTSIGSSAFSGCKGLTSITISDGVTSIGDSAFNNCKGLTSITIPDSVTSIGSSTFSGCTSLTSITIPNSVTSIGSNAFYGCTGLTSITIPNSVTSIGSDAFSYCTSLTSITIPDSVTSIGIDAFSGCTGLTSITIPDSVTSIGREAFYGCTGLTSITIPNSVTSIGSDAFSGCTSLNTVYYKGSESEWNNLEIRVYNKALNNANIIFNYN